MNCESVRENLSAYLDRELEPELRTHVEAHLVDCPTCRAELEALTRTVRLVASLPKVRAPGSVLDGVEEHLERGALLAGSRPEPPRPRRFGFLKALGGLAAAAVLLIMAHVAWQSIGKAPETPLVTRGALESDTDRNTTGGTLPTGKGGTIYFNDANGHKAGQQFFYMDVDPSWEPLADGTDEIRIVLAAADLDNARQLIQTAVAELTPQEGYAFADDTEQLARTETFAGRSGGPDDALKKTASALEIPTEATPTAPEAQTTPTRTPLFEGEPTKDKERAGRELRDDAPAPAVTPKTIKLEAEKQDTDKKEISEALPVMQKKLSEDAKSQKSVVVLTVPADQLDALLARLSRTKGLTMKSPVHDMGLYSFGTTVTELGQTRVKRTDDKGRKESDVTLGPTPKDRADDEARAKTDVTAGPTTEESVPGEKKSPDLVRVVIYLETLEADTTPATPAPAPTP